MNPVKCPACSGRGSHPGSAPKMRVRCRGCDGKGLLWVLAPIEWTLLPQPPIQPPVPSVQPQPIIITNPDVRWDGIRWDLGWVWLS